MAIDMHRRERLRTADIWARKVSNGDLAAESPKFESLRAQIVRALDGAVGLPRAIPATIS